MQMRLLHRANDRLIRQRQNKPMQPVSIIAMGCAFPGAKDAEALWSLLWDQRTVFDAAFQSQSFQVARVSLGNPSHDCVMESWEQAKAAWDKLKGDTRTKFLQRTGLVIANLGFPNIQGATSVQTRVRDRLSKAIGVEATHALCLDAACASSLVALGLAVTELDAHGKDVMVVSCNSAADPEFIHKGFTALGALSQKGHPTPFGKDADGLLPAEGSATFVLMRAEMAKSLGIKSLGNIRGFSMNNDGRTASLLTPAALGQEACMRDAWQRAALDPESCVYLECHATGTLVGDAVEVQSVQKVFPEGLPVGSIKANLGHPLTAAGGASVAKMLLAFHQGSLPAMPQSVSPIGTLGHLEILQNHLPVASKRFRVGINAFGFGGNNAHLILEHPDVLSTQAIGTSKGDTLCMPSGSTDMALMMLRDGQLAKTTELEISEIRFPPLDLKNHAHPFQRQALALAQSIQQILKQASLKKYRVGVLVACDCYPEVARWHWKWNHGHQNVHELQAQDVLGNMLNVYANRISFQYDLTGPSFAINGNQAYETLEHVAKKIVAAGFADAMLMISVGEEPFVAWWGERPTFETPAYVMIRPPKERMKKLLDVTHAASVHDVITHKHLEYMRLMSGAFEGLTRALGRAAHPPDTSFLKPQATAEGRDTPLYNKEQLRIHAGGKISQVFGEAFQSQDNHHVQVRMPMGPLLLCDRVMLIEGPAKVLGQGRIVTETDVLPDAYYLHDGRMPVGFTIESGQADLMLISWMGIDDLNQGKRKYRLLGCELTFHRPLPKVGETLRYDIRIHQHAVQGDVRLFFFSYECWIGDERFLSVREGQAGFFTEAELQSSQGVIVDRSASAFEHRTLQTEERRWTEKRAFSQMELDAYCNGDMFACFGHGFERTAAHHKSPRPAFLKERFLQEVVSFDPVGHQGQGYLKIKSTLRGDEWFFDGHFKNDPCMPGTLMYEASLHSMMFMMSALGYATERDAWRFEPFLNKSYKMICRGQVTPQSKEVIYEVFVHQHGLHEGKPVLFADLLCTVDGLCSFFAKDMGMSLVPDWPMVGSTVDPLMAAALGSPAVAFPHLYQGLEHRAFPRLPAPPYHFMQAVEALECDLAKGALGAQGSRVRSVCRVVPEDQWWQEDGYSMAALMECALQPCGWLASHVGCAKLSPETLLFRNLDGEARLHRALNDWPQDKTMELITEVELTNISQLGSMIIVHFDVKTDVKKADGALEKLWDIKTSFGFFPKEAFVNQAGLQPIDGEETWQSVSQSVDPYAWYFKAHFFQDPVQPGSLGVERALNLMKTQPHFDITTIRSFLWKYRGQVTPESKETTIAFKNKMAAFFVDSKKIYEIKWE